MNIGFVGLGAMGAGIVPRLMAAGHAVTGWNRSKKKAEPLVAAAMSRGTMPAPMAPRPTKPMFMRSPRWCRVSRAQRSMSEREWCAADPGPSQTLAVPDQRCTATRCTASGTHIATPVAA